MMMDFFRTRVSQELTLASQKVQSDLLNELFDVAKELKTLLDNLEMDMSDNYTEVKRMTEMFNLKLTLQNPDFYQGVEEVISQLKKDNDYLGNSVQIIQ
jgi:hypothetical protein